MAAAVHFSGEDELQDLSHEDARELRAFQEKRRWFEGKLKLLEDLPPIYPFVLPTLKASKADPSVFVYANEETSANRLPKADTLRTWQSERDALEEEVLAFDGGDLGRMKEKTREVTLVPLTKPSTHLVAITLDLILLIDRLLTLLRRRYDVLELVALRLQWDVLRWKVMRECEGLKVDIRTFAEGEGRWKVPLDAEGLLEAREAVTPVKRSTPLDLPDSVSKRDAISASPAVSPTTNRTFTIQSPRTPTSPKSIFSPHSFASPTSKSHPQSLSARYRAVTSTHLKRSSAILDRMIDIAGPLKDLGGLHGPVNSVNEEEEGGALPDELLDMQDDLEALCEDVKKRVGWCKELEDQRDRAERSHSATTRSRAQADRVIIQLRDSLSQPATSAQHEHLSDLLRQAESALPAPIDKTFPRPRHPDYPDTERHATEILAILGSGRSAAQEQCAISSDGVGWYARLEKARVQLEEEDASLITASEAFGGMAESLAKLRRAGQSESAADRAAYLSAAPGHIARLAEQLPGLTRQVQILQMSNMAYKSALQPPTSIRSLLGPVDDPDSLHDAVERRVEDALRSIRDAEGEMKLAEANMEVLPVIMRFEAGTEDLEGKLRKLRPALTDAIDASAWREGEAVSVSEDRMTELRRAVEVCEELYRSILAERAEVDRLQGGGRKDDLSQAREQRAAVVMEEMRDIRDLMGLLQRVAEQSRAVVEAEREAEALLGRLRGMSAPNGANDDTEGGARGGAGEDTAERMAQDVKAWVDGLAVLIPFVSATCTLPGDPAASEAGTAGEAEAELEGRTSSGSAAVPVCGYSTDLKALDQSVRGHINDLSSRITSALANVLARLSQPPPAKTSTDTLFTSSTDSLSPSGPLTPEGEDVFGSREPRTRTSSSAHTLRPSPSTDLNSPLSHIRHLRKRIRSLEISDIVFPSGSAILRTPSLQRLPDEGTVRAITANLAEVEGEADKAHLSNGAEEEMKALKKLQAELAAARAFVPRLEALAAFSARSKACDEVFGRLMDVLESTEGEEPKLSSENEMAQAKEALKDAEEAGMAVENDKRVISELKHLRAIWTDLSVSLGQADDMVSIISSETPTIASIASPYVSRIPVAIPKPRLNSALSTRSNLSGISSGTRSTSNPFPRITATTESYRNRSISGSGEGARRRVDSSASMTPRLMSGSAPPGAVGGRLTPSRIPRLPTMSPYGGLGRPSSAQGKASRIRKSSMPIPMASVKEKGRDKENGKARLGGDRAYMSDPKSTLDQAVGKIVNKLKMSVPIVPVNIAGADEWKDQSGRYWIGAHGRAKLCYCRILRSRTVMVRVGGGWMELSKFLKDHFADALWQTPLEGGGPGLPPMTPMRTGSSSYGPPGNEPRSVHRPGQTPTGSTFPSSASKLTPSENGHTSSTPSAAPNPDDSSIFSPMTPIRESHAPQVNSNSRTRPRSSLPLSRSSSFFSPLHSPHTPGSTNSDRGDGGGPSSPLVPLHFLKKASESPPIREREKEKLGVGRRSILGKEG